VTTFNAIRGAGVPAGGRVAVFGLGGLGHLAVQFAAAMGYETIALARGAERSAAAARLGADRYVDTEAESPAAVLAGLGGADLVVYTASDTGPATQLLGGLAGHGRLVLVGVDAGRLAVPVADLVMHAHRITGHLTGSPRDTEDAMRFAVRNGVRPVIEQLPLRDAATAIERLRRGAVRFRTVLDPWERR
jgi:alcohol dehydrogenase